MTKRTSCEACVFCDPGFIILVMRGDGGLLINKPMNHLHHLSPSPGHLPHQGVLTSSEPGVHQWICDSSPKALHEDLLMANRHAAGESRETTPPPPNQRTRRSWWGGSWSDSIYSRTRHGNHNRLAPITLPFQYFRRSPKRL